MDGKDINGLKLEKIGLVFQVLILCSKITKNIMCSTNSFDTFLFKFSFKTAKSSCRHRPFLKIAHNNFNVYLIAGKIRSQVESVFESLYVS